jgi:iron transport multicopper oxidase
MKRLAALLALSAAVTPAFAATVRKTLSVEDAPMSPDGFPREATLVDGKLPGTVITGKKGDRFEITVANNLVSDNMYKVTSVHWHGIHMHHTTWADGSATVSQCPIVPADSFKYVFDTSAKGSPQSGTFWYHSHFSSQYCDGLRGALVIKDDQDPIVYNYSPENDNEETIISLGDWFHFYGKTFHPGPTARPPFPDSVLINGKGRDPKNPVSDLAVITVDPGKRYRMRVIQMACYTAFDYSIDGHTLEVIEADSIKTVPYEVDSITVFAGQRYSHILDTRNKKPDAYWIRAQPERLNIKYEIRDSTGAKDTVPYWKDNTNVAVLRYSNSPNQMPKDAADVNVPVIKKPLVESKLRPLVPAPAPGRPGVGNADVNVELKSTFNTAKDGLFRINNATYTAPDVPILLQIMNGNKDAQSLLPQGSVIPLPAHKTVEVRIKGTTKSTGGPHPFHLHGHDFYVIKTANSTQYNFIDPIQRDTISSGLEDDEAIIRFRTDNPGPWFLHCHLDWHLDMGMGIVMAEDVPHTAAENKPTEEWNELCDKYDTYMSGGGNNKEAGHN